ncbi:aminotransferase class I/II-fold pyridoxal phosphate-dependent enzyme [Acidithiobacillus thiooxidans]|uniref:aminotransferase class I/II-fold pyridoxal phosphate-dependent enzyme n=1 Tax=Acidithiobacillus thiooxidans TaxID=930 RepID=UPI0002624DB0|nr:aminotransferase class I/II-fold pyridoxal phosphate-dependent enzyme [Acidithiobacillus thiooxidans]MBU2811794.1 aminotransferase class I/II-fold pyridoxal phosphate-dependent enzyme [Acidithiobacillus thiooxidans]
MTKADRSIAAQFKEKLIQKGLEQRLQKIQTAPAPGAKIGGAEIPEAFTRFDRQPGYQQVHLMQEGAERFGVKSPFFHVHQGTAGAHSAIDGRRVINFGSYNYLGLSGHPEVNAAAQAAIAQYGSSVSASRIVAGERPLHRQLEQALADFYGVDDALTFVSGHATNVTTIGHLLGPRDLILHDEYAHNSIVQGALLSGAQRLSFPHNDLNALETLLRQQRRKAERVLIVVEGMYSMDGDFPDLPRLIDLKKKHQAWLMVDEAHSFGVLGATGRGIAEHFSINTHDVDIWMGTLSKTLAACGGYIAGEQALIDNLRYLAPGFLYSVGLAPPLAAAALAALTILQKEPDRVHTLQERGQYFLEEAKRRQMDTGFSAGYAITPLIVGSSLQAVRLSSQLLEQGVHVQPILYPAVPEKQARLRFFLNVEHSTEELRDSLIRLKGLC